MTNLRATVLIGTVAAVFIAAVTWALSSVPEPRARTGGIAPVRVVTIQLTTNDPYPLFAEIERFASEFDFDVAIDLLWPDYPSFRIYLERVDVFLFGANLLNDPRTFHLGVYPHRDGPPVSVALAETVVAQLQSALAQVEGVVVSVRDDWPE